MTTTAEIQEAKETTKPSKDNITSCSSTVPNEIMDIMEFLSHNTRIIFKSQQRDEPELQEKEKLKVALDVYKRNPQTFLIRFGNYLEEIHLENFARLSIADGDHEMQQMVTEYKHKLKNRQRDIKNRRYTALNKLIEEGEYFSEQEMMKRQPELYQDLVGQYLSKREKQLRDSYDVRNTTFSGILMHNLEQKELNDIMEKADNDVKNTQTKENCARSSTESLEKEYDEIPLNCRRQWGNFDNEQIACSSSKSHTTATSVLSLITADERELLRQEFISQMHEQFLNGQDKDFDYQTIDENTQFDDLNLISQDQEDKYFDESDEDDSVDPMDPDINKREDEETEDELDAYMSHLNKHHSLQKNFA